MTVALGFNNVAVLGGAISLGLAMLPDWDQRIPFLPHRGITHTLQFALLVAVGLGLVGLLVGFERGLFAAIGTGVFGALVGGLTIGSHIAADALTPAGVEPFGNGRQYSYDVARADSLLANYLLLTAGGGAALLAWSLGSVMAGPA